MGCLINLLLVSASFLSVIQCQDWGDPFFVPLENPAEGLEYGTPTPNGIPIFLDENVPADEDQPLHMITINYNGDTTPSLRLVVGSFALLKPRVVRGDDRYWVFVIAESQDYENQEMRIYTIDININGVTKTIFLNIRNLDDNAPVIEVTPCVVPELYVGRTNCTFLVKDADGFLSTDNMSYELETRPDEVDLFGVLEIEKNEFDTSVVLLTLKALKFDKSQLHIFNLVARDTANEGRAQVIVRVEDVEDMPPMWTSLFALQKYDEKTPKTFYLEAIDGDTGINKPICYRLEDVNPLHAHLFSVNTTSGRLDVEAIDRDFWKQEVFEFNAVPYKCDNYSWSIESKVAIIIDDINDNPPRINMPIFDLTIPENSYVSMNFSPPIEIDDIDLGLNARYNVKLESVYPTTAADAFLIIPDAGYQLQEFQLTIINASMLDFDDIEWQKINLTITAEETAAPFNSTTSLVTIHLENWNDELPIFKNEAVLVNILETVPKGTILTTLTATDRDIDDVVIHKLVGSVNNILNIDELTGRISVAVDDAFDYQRQNEIIVQVSAEDTLGEPYHKVFAQLTINLTDVNNKPPDLVMPRYTPEVEENVPKEHIINEDVVGRDPDSTAEIEFSINWDASYATKQGSPTPEEEYRECLTIETVYPDLNKKGYALGRLRANEIRDNVTIDFETFEVLYLVIGLNDTKQELGDGYFEGMLTIKIIDLNDNPPVWVDGTLTVERFVREEANGGTPIGSVQAIDIDGPNFNKVTYSIKPTNGTPDSLVRINQRTGQIEVNESRAIDADIPKRYFLYYSVTATDCDVGIDPCFQSTNDIKISITDTNNKFPFFTNESELVYVEIYENETTGFEIITVETYDYDRDEFYHTIDYTVDYQSYPELRKYFSINSTTGVLIVDLQDGVELDRDDPLTETHDIYLLISDNYLLQGDRVRRENKTMIHLQLLDVNDNAPVLPPTLPVPWTVLENTTKGYRLPNITAPDRDQPDTNNSRVMYDILSINCTNRPDENIPDDLFVMLSPDYVSGILEVNRDLEGYWGTYDVHILAYDLGVPTMSTNETYELTIRPYNYMTPQISFPTDKSIIRLSKEMANVDATLYTSQNIALELFTAKDEDGLYAGEVTFDIAGTDAAREYFRIDNLENNRGRLVLTKMFDTVTSFEVRVRATDGGTEPGPLSSTIVTTVVFVSTRGVPVYDDNLQTVKFTEFEMGLSETEVLYEAEDPINFNCTNDCRDIFYYIVDGETKDMFKLENRTNHLKVAKPLNRTQTQIHTIKILATNSDVPDINWPPDSILTVTVQVREENPKPNFEKDSYTAGLTKSDEANRLLLTVKAIQSENLTVTYSFDGSITVTDSTLEDVKDRAFRLNENTGELFSLFRPNENMRGRFNLKIKATDTDGKHDSIPVTIFVVGDINRVSFIFDNGREEVFAEREFIAEVFSLRFDYLCNIDEIEPTSTGDTSMVTHFIGEDELPVDAKTIEEKKSDVLLMNNLQRDLSQKNLSLSDFGSTNPNPGPDESLEKTLQIILIVVSTVLGTLCLVLLIAYCIRTKSLNKKLKALSETKFSSQDSGLNRIGVPGTNKHAIEGSNPVWNEEIKQQPFDTISNASGDSDLIGIENDPQFEYAKGSDKRNQGDI